MTTCPTLHSNQGQFWLDLMIVINVSNFFRRSMKSRTEHLKTWAIYFYLLNISINEGIFVSPAMYSFNTCALKYNADATYMEAD